MTSAIMLVGIPASGKSTLAQSLAKQHSATIHSSDAIRAELYGDESTQGSNNEVFNILHNRISADLAKGQSVIYDACNINYKQRMQFLSSIAQYKPRTMCYMLVKSYEQCLADNKKRERIVPEHVIKRMLTSIWIPQAYEGWDGICIVYPDDIVRPLQETVDTLMAFDQENKWHSYTLGEHLTRTAGSLLDTDDANLITAGLCHDIGKPFVKSFENHKRVKGDSAHYYNHSNVSAYEYLLKEDRSIGIDNILDTANLIQWHMRPYDLARNDGKGTNKFTKLIGEETYKRLMLLHEADKAAH